MKKFLFTWLVGAFLILQGPAFAQEIIRGTVLDQSTMEPLPGATVRVEGAQNLEITDENGQFSLTLSEGNYQLTVSFIGFGTQTVDLSIPLKEEIRIVLVPSDMELQGVEVVATGYQELPKERVTGSFVSVDEELLNRSVSPDILSRLENVTSGLLINPRAGVEDRISIRGKSTFFANSQPLIVVDNFPYDGPLENINPNDVEQVTVLRDAAAASIWGARAGNGVIVITTKNGRYNQPLKVSFNANTRLFEKPDAFYAQNMSPADFLEVEELLYSRNFYNSALNSRNQDAITPGVELFHALKNGEITQEEADRQLAFLRAQDLRQDINRYIYQPQLDQQYALQVSGGDQRQRYGISLGYDQSRENIQGNDRHRITFKGNQEFKFWKERLTFSNQIALIRNKATTRNQGLNGLIFTGLTETYPYARLADAQGNPLPVVRNFRQRFVQEAAQQGLLNWEYFPLKDIGESVNSTTSNEFRWTSALIFQPLKSLSVELSYQYWANNQLGENFNSPESYFSRNLINTYTQIREDGSLVYPVPLGAILNRNSNEGESHQFRSLIRYSLKTGNHQLNVLGGFEAKDYQLNSYSTRYYGYSPQLASTIPVDYLNPYPFFYNPSLSQVIPFGSGLGDLTDRFLSYYGNAGYTFDNKVDLTASFRKDQSNLFGVRANQRGVPLYSLGLGWTISEMDFFKWDQLPFLKIRSSYGYNGNIDKTLTGETTALFLTSSFFGFNPGLPYARILNPPYPDLSWERIEIVNLGLDFESKNARLSGSVEYYIKNGVDLIADTQLPPSSGLESFRGNSANTRGTGWDIILNSVNVQRSLTWSSQLLFSTNRETVTRYLLEEPISSVLSNGGVGFGRVYPVEGYPLYAMFSYPWAGLNPDNGNPQGFLDGSPSEDFTAIIRESGINDLVFHGSARPTVFGALRNTFAWKGLSLSFNISYKLGYYYRRNSVLYNSLLRGNPGHADYALRWQNPGDEQITNVPSIPGNPNLNRDNLYRFSEVLVEKGDHIRFQDINVTYRFADFPGGKKRMLSNLEIYSYINNLGILWKASDDPLDPEFRNLNPMRSFSLGLRGTF
ncbi:MAG: membrane receptor RagA [Algoriphagus sp.]|jgi:TonB-dependent starch-binding outer membrane protein SusC|uniref:SusC/RagA family TonB-linked outer membrane protein n=2 Tax=Algoriphagus TaxID=246875 RepID=UPI000C3B1B10|nr:MULTISPECIES: SusC/RagA family TonB-linked outer membrane protein [unclassified Algoriphagus]MAL12916.1 membrane receptor RagA [Algoriphagus sp.]QYH39188.1 SusC/RagA family TonB-linked outer membrane protein [Algoriphagus sp. NBT04N3]HAS58280.1 SusC/RagA family TonB-linked outer membrane protein [Algoriphagus sp.]|tara:strand:+ start:5706 stop:8927 length:3222 start_codon:yes stop_codon:yes gene_type:complete